MLTLLLIAVLLGSSQVKHQRLKHRTPEHPRTGAPSRSAPSKAVSSRGVPSISPTAKSTTALFEAQFDEQGIGRGVRPRILHPYDPHLPGFRVQAAIATLLIRPHYDHSTSRTTDRKSPDRLVLAIRTSSPAHPMLESFTLITSDVTVQSSLNQTEEEIRPAIKPPNNSRADGAPGEKPVHQVPRGTYFRFEVVGEEVHVTFLPKAMELLQRECRVEWVDWYR